MSKVWVICETDYEGHLVPPGPAFTSLEKAKIYAWDHGVGDYSSARTDFIVERELDPDTPEGKP